MDCRIKSGNDECETSPSRRKTPCQEFAALAQALAIDTMADAGREVPLYRNVQRGEALRRLEQSLRRNEVVAVAMHQQNRRPRFDLGSEGFGTVEFRRQDEQPGITDDRGRRHATTQPDMQRHHRALAEADQRQRGWGKLMAGTTASPG